MQVLARMHDLIIPSMVKPVLLAGAWPGCYVRYAGCTHTGVSRSSCRVLVILTTLPGSTSSYNPSLYPWLACPPADFLTATLDKGGLTGMLALNGIFELVRRLCCAGCLLLCHLGASHAISAPGQP